MPKFISLHEWRFVRPDFLGWDDHAPWTKVIVSEQPFVRVVPEAPDGAEFPMSAKHVKWLADYIEEMVRTFRDAGHPEQARRWQDTAMTSERTLLIRTNMTDHPTSRHEVGMRFANPTVVVEGIQWAETEA